MGRIGQPGEIADPVVFLLSDEARYVAGHTLPRRWWCVLTVIRDEDSGRAVEGDLARLKTDKKAHGCSG